MARGTDLAEPSHAWGHGQHAAGQVPEFFLKKTANDFKPDEPQTAMNLDPWRFMGLGGWLDWTELIVI